MHVITVLASFLVLSGSLFSHEHYQYLGLTADSKNIRLTQFNLSHDSYFIRNEHYLSLSAGYKPYLSGAQHFEGGIGYRKFFRTVAFGINAHHYASNKNGAFLHEFAPGVEFFTGKFQISANHYLPFKTQASVKGRSVYHHAISEIGVTYRASKTFEIGVLPFFDHQARRFGYNSNIVYSPTNMLDLRLSPFYKNASHGIVFAFGVKFGGSKSKSTQPIRKSSHFMTHSDAPIVEKPVVSFVPAPDPTIPAPVFLPPIVQEDPVVVANPIPKEEEVPIPPKPKPEPTKRWYDIFSKVRGKPA